MIEHTHNPKTAVCARMLVKSNPSLVYPPRWVCGRDFLQGKVAVVVAPMVAMVTMVVVVCFAKQFSACIFAALSLLLVTRAPWEVECATAYPLSYT